MTHTRAMLNIVMDGIRDSSMLLDYAEMQFDNDIKNWFTAHARKRVECLEQDYEFVKNRIKLPEKIKDGDDIAEALHCHIVEQMAKLEERL